MNALHHFPPDFVQKIFADAVAPRFGAAYRLDSQSVLRAGWGIFYDTGFAAALDPVNGFPFNRWQFTLGGAAPPNGPGFGLRAAPKARRAQSN